MKSIYDRENVRVRITKVVYHSSDGESTHNILSVIEAVEPDMQDYSDLINYSDSKTCVAISMSIIEVRGCDLKDYLLLIEGDVCFDGELLREPHNPELFSILTKDCDEQVVIKVLPYREGPIYASSFISRGQTLELLKSEDALESVCNVVKNKLGIDLYKYQEMIGSAHLVWYHQWLRQISLRACDDPAGILLMTEKRDEENHSLVIDISDYHKDGSLVQSLNRYIQNVSRCQLVQLKQPVSTLDFKVYDEDGDLVYGMKDITFVRQINVNIGIEDTKAVGKQIHTEKIQIGSIKEDADKYLNEAAKKRNALSAIEEALKTFDRDTQANILNECLKKLNE